MASRINVLILAPDPTLAALVESHLTQTLDSCAICHVDDSATYSQALLTLRPNLVIVEHTRSPNSLGDVVEETARYAPEASLILLIDADQEDAAIDAVEAGAWDYVLKKNLRRLASTARRALTLRQARAEHQETKQSLAQSEHRLRVAQQLGRIGTWEVDLETGKLFWSDAVYAIYGRDPKLGPPSEAEELAYYPESSFHELRQLATRALESGEPYELSLRLRRDDGSPRDVTVIGTPLSDPRGRVTRLLGTVQDVTERRSANNRIRELNSVLEAIRHVHQLIMRERDRARLIEETCNLLAGRRRYSGAWIVLLPAQGAPPLFAHAGFSPGSPELEALVTYASHFQAEATGSGFRATPPSTAPDGPQFPRHPSGSPHAHTVSVMIDTDDAQLGVLGVAVGGGLDLVTEEANLLREIAADLGYALRNIELEAQRNRFSQIVASSHEAMALVSPQFTYLETNLAYGRLLGKPPSRLVGQRVSDFVSSAFFEQTVMPNLELCFAGRPVEFETDLKRSDGELRRLAVVYSPCLVGSSSVIAAAVCIRDITVQSAAITALRAGEQRFRLLSECAGVGIGYYALDGTLLFFNSKAAQYMGGAPSDFVGKSLIELYGEELAELIAKRIALVASGHSPETFGDEVRLGSDCSWFLSTYAAIVDDTGAAIGVQIISHDITDLKRVEATLQMERDNLGTFLAAAPAAILVLNRELELVHCNLAAERLLNPAALDTLGERWVSLLRCEERSAHTGEGATKTTCPRCTLYGLLCDTITRRASVTGKQIRIELRLGSQSDSRWLIASAEPMSLDDGPGTVLALQDDTERKLAAELLEYQALLLKSQNEASIDGILLEDQVGRWLWNNKRFAELLGLAPGGLTSGSDSTSIADIIELLEDGTDFERNLAEVAQDRNLKTRAELRLKDGRVLDQFGAPVLGNAGEYLGRVWLLRDITAEKALRAAVAQSDRLASMGMLAAGVAHEINNPLSYVIYNLESVVEDLEPRRTKSPDRHHALGSRASCNPPSEPVSAAPYSLDTDALTDMSTRCRSALDGARRIKAIAKGLGTFARVEQGRIAAICVSDPIDSALAIASNEIKYRARVEKELLSTSFVLASDGQLSQVFLNLLINAAHSIADGNADNNFIRIRTWDEGSQIVATVEDSGCGIPEENFERVFDAFYTTKPVGVGSGLGLNIVRNIIATCGGRIDVSSRVGVGTRFTIRLPVATPNTRHSQAPPMLSQNPTLGPFGRLLLVDDEQQVRTALCRILTGHCIVQRQSGEEAQLLLAQDQNFDLILSDVMMPRMSGIELHQWLVSYFPRLARRLVFVTGGAFTPGMQAYLDGCENPRLDKPFDPSSFRQQVAEWVRIAQTDDCAALGNLSGHRDESANGCAAAQLPK